MKSEIKKVIEKGLKDYRTKLIRVGDKEYKLSIFDEDEDINLFEGFLFAEAEEKSELAIFKKYRAPVSGYTPRIGLIFYNDTFLIKDYRQNRHILKTIRKVNDTFLKKLKKALAEPKADTFNKLFDRTDIIEEFYILYKKSRDFLLDNVKGISDEEKREVFVDNFMLQMLTLWYLQEREFFDGDKSYFITKFNDLKQKRLTGDVSSYYGFLRYFFDKISNSVDRQYIDDDPAVGKVVVVGPAIFLNGGQDSESISIPEKCFYKDGVTKTLIDTPPKKVSADVPLFNLFESRDWTEGDMDEYVLGALYEKLITQDVRKKTGAYYTPEEITSYICRNTIEPYLVDRVNDKLNWNYESAAQVVDGADKKLLLFLFELLKEIKILDPAVGSAHFLESAINVLLGVYERIWYRAKELKMQKGLVVKSSDESGNVIDVELLEISSEEQFRLYVKFFIILSRNIYGVDINPGALKVAKARLFLTLAKHFDAGKNYFIRFPNVHFNLREGNSLIGYAELETPKGQTSFDMYVNEDDAVYVSESVKVVARLGDYLPKTTKALGISGDVVGEVKALNKILSKKTIDWHDFNTVLRTKEKLIKILIVSLNSEYARPLNELLHQITVLFNSKLDARFADEHGIDFDDLKTIQTFHWVFEFPEVFLDRGGFDVVVGNPPYVRADVDDERLIIQRTVLERQKEYPTLFEKWDLFLPFIERSIRGLINNNGKFSFIVSDAICTVKYAEKMRKWLAEEFYIPEINHFEGFQVFVGVGIVPVVFFIDKSRKPAKTNKILHSDSFDKITHKLVDQDSPSLFKKTEGDILEFEYNNSEKLGDICYISYGLRPNADEKIAKGEFRKEDVISEILSHIHSKKYIEGKDIKRYIIDTIKYLEWDTERCPNKIARKTFPELYFGKKMIRGRVTEGLIDTQDIVVNDSIILFKLFLDLSGVNNRSILTSIKKHNNLPRTKLEKISKNYSYEYLLAIMNSTFANKYLNAVRRHKLKNYFYPDDFRKLPIKKLNNQDVFVNLVNYLHFLYSHESSMADFFDRQLADSLVYELYFCEKFHEDELYPEPKHYLLDAVSKHLKPIDYDRWSELHYKAQLEANLTAPKAQELAALEGANMQTIMDVYDALRIDADVGEWIERIRGHEWVKVVEGDSNA